MKRTLVRLKPRWLFWATLGGLCGAVTLGALLRPAELPPLIVLHRPFKTPANLRDRIGACIPTRPGWAWAWSIERAVFGARKPVAIQCDIFRFTNLAECKLPPPLCGAPCFSGTNGLRAWQVHPLALESVRNELKKTLTADLVSEPRVSVADGVESRLFVGQAIPLNGTTTEVGTMMVCLPRVHAHATDLILHLRLSELMPMSGAGLGSSPVGPTPLIRTNIDAVLRLQLPKDGGMFLFYERSGDPTQKLGVMLTACRS